MKRVTILSIASALLVALGLLGGLHYDSFSRYVPPSPANEKSESNFRICVRPEFRSGGSSGLKHVIPFLFFREWESLRDPHIRLDLAPSSEVYGYDGKTTLTVESLSVRSSTGKSFSLISPTDTKTFSLIHSEEGSQVEDLGAVEGDDLTIATRGHVVTSSGDQKQFAQEQRWLAVKSSHWGLGIFMGE